MLESLSYRERTKDARSPVSIRWTDIEFKVIRLIHWDMPHAQSWPRHPEFLVGVNAKSQKSWVGAEILVKLSHRHYCPQSTKIRANWLPICVCEWETELELVPAEGFLLGSWLFEGLPHCGLSVLYLLPSYQLDATLCRSHSSTCGLRWGREPGVTVGSLASLQRTRSGHCIHPLVALFYKQEQEFLLLDPFRRVS